MYQCSISGQRISFLSYKDLPTTGIKSFPQWVTEKTTEHFFKSVTSGKTYCRENKCSHTLLVDMQISTILLEKNLAIPNKTTYALNF